MPSTVATFSSIWGLQGSTIHSNLGLWSHFFSKLISFLMIYFMQQKSYASGPKGCWNSKQTFLILKQIWFIMLSKRNVYIYGNLIEPTFLTFLFSQKKKHFYYPSYMICNTIKVSVEFNHSMKNDYFKSSIRRAYSVIFIG